VTVDFSVADLRFFINQLEKGRVVLFAGAGFSAGAKTPSGQEPPLSTQLAQLLCKECGWEYGGDELALVFEQAEKHLGTQGLYSFLERHFLHCSPADWHRLIPPICWHRIYTTNIDDVIKNTYNAVRGQQRLRLIVCPAPYRDPDFFMEEVTCVHLHGSVEERGKRLTFTLEDFAHTTASPSPWYQVLIDDMQARTVLFVGTRLNEPPFYHYLALRELRSPRSKDVRAKAYLVSPSITQVRARQLRDQNIIPVTATAEDFFLSLHAFLSGQLPQRTAILRALYPHQLEALERRDAPSPAQLLRQFDFILPDSLPDRHAPLRSLFYLGAEPTWSDIRQNVDARRDVTDTFLAQLLSPESGARCFVVAGYAGSGKTTLMMRTACELARHGRTVYFFKGETLLEPEPLRTLSDSLRGRQAYVFIDTAARQSKSLLQLVNVLADQETLILVIADRSHVMYTMLPSLAALMPTVCEMPELNREDTTRILDKLDETGFLGVLRGQSQSAQISAFLVRARKQLLVALREATSGKGFDAILAGEFATLSNDQARLAYVIASLAVLHGAPGVRRRHLLACLDGSDLEKSRVLVESLRDVVIARGADGDLLTPRHRIIGRFVAVELSPLDTKIEAVRRLLTQVSQDITPYSIRRRVPEYITYRGLINFDGMTELFGLDYEVILGLYEELKAYYRHDFLFWLQYGRAEIEFNNFDVAENYLNQSLGIRPESHQTQHHLGVLYLKRSYSLAPYARALEDAQRGEDILRHQIQARGSHDAYPYNALLVHKLRFLQRISVPNGREQMQTLYDLAKTARNQHPFDAATKDAADHVERAYLMQAVRDQ